MFLLALPASGGSVWLNGVTGALQVIDDWGIREAR